ncbi:SycD/LcrH family type III secretion system chaperone [Castellaniella defragrans]|uniref:Type III secretion system low calcium response chaperone LcrH/SycD n=1 Tax=Castellaniella defragrans TaxID=75697 RepID=A0A7W9TQD8_CASDE|nr:SycD/LcrH family type III secretion system chaperone [Castellaniella defragrans]KAB0602094.1 CesD/SycD/LcrH family type III secretion system chaperone [Castellaniella defragrans]MBB6084955.1 type III secretion system low calcium response chaperone LcrH/SycD [Castellaniella defragrans]
MSQPATESRSRFGQQLYDELQALPSGARLSAEQLEVVYALAYAHVIQGQYAQALPIFSILAIYGPTRRHYLAGLALCLEQCERYEEAIRMYSLLITLFPGSMEPALQIAECLLMLGRTAEAAEELDRVLRGIAESGGRYDALRPRAQLLRDLAGRGTA